MKYPSVTEVLGRYSDFSRVTINRVSADEWEAIDKGLMADLKKEVNP